MGTWVVYLGKEIWSGEVSGYVQNLYGASRHLSRQLVSGGIWSPYSYNDKDHLPTGIGALLLYYHQDSGQRNYLTVDRLRTDYAFNSYGEFESSETKYYSTRLYQEQVNGVVREQYSYDENGNRLNVTDAAGTRVAEYDSHDRLKIFAGTTHYFYDARRGVKRFILPSGKDIEYIN